MSTQVSLLDYGVGNLFNLRRAFEHLGCECTLITDIDAIRSAARLVIPGVGAFGEGIANIEKLGVVSAVREYARSGKPLMGICLGMQLLFDESEELGRWKGLEIIPGSVTRFAQGSWKLPHIAWNSLEHAAHDSWSGTVLDGVPEGALMYFNHSYFVTPVDSRVGLASTQYAGIRFVSVARKDNVSACQFHPERSGEWGLKLLSNFARLGA
jgi:glutamine amidotransferase